MLGRSFTGNENENENSNPLLIFPVFITGNNGNWNQNLRVESRAAAVLSFHRHIKVTISRDIQDIESSGSFHFQFFEYQIME
jgi:hypothetical protein